MKDHKVVLHFLLLWIYFIATFVLVAFAKSPNLTLLNGDESAHCIISDEKESTAMIMIKNGHPIDESRYIKYPNGTEDFFCKTSTERNCENKFINSIWKYDFSDNFDIEPITDRRWEDFNTIKTNASSFESEKIILKNYTLFSVLHHGMDPRSIYIYLLGNNNNERPLCYINITGLHKPNLCNFSNSDKYICEELKEAGSITIATWSHFMLTFDEGKLTLTERYKNFTLSFSPKSKPTHIAFGSDTKAIWKLHSYGLFTSNSTGDTSIDITNGQKDQKICVAVFVRSCKNSNLALELLDKNNNILVTQTPSNGSMWEELKLETLLTEDTDLKLQIKLETDFCSSYIGDIRNCADNKRIISVNYKKNEDANSIKCSLIKFIDKEYDQNVKVVPIPSYADNSSIEIIWPSNGDNQPEYYIHHKMCRNENFDWKKLTKTKTINSLSITSIKTIPFAIYHFKLGMINSSYESFSTEQPSEEEFPEPECKQENNQLIVHFKIRDCEKNYGPLFYHIIINCTNNWCKNDSGKYVKPANISTDSMNIDGLTDYTVYLGISRLENDTNINYKTFCSLKTKPTVPKKVKNLRVFEQTNTSISIRWSEPKPKTGDLEVYILEYAIKELGFHTNLTQYNITNPIRCGIWSDTDYCETLHNLPNNIDYIIRMRAKNKDVEGLSNISSSIDASTIENPPTAPLNLTLDWGELFNATVNCQYPLNSIGPVRELHILINTKLITFDIPNDTRSYSFEIDVSNFSSSRQEIAAIFSNFGGKSEPIHLNETFPPKTPKILDGFIKKNNDSIYTDLNFVENVDGESELYIFQIDNTLKSQILMRNCKLDDFNIIKNISRECITIDLKRNEKMYTLKNNTDEDLKVFFVAYIKNTFENFSKCSTYSDEPIFIIDNNRKDPPTSPPESDNLIVIIIVLLLLFAAFGVTIYMYKTKKIPFKRKLSNVSTNVIYKNSTVTIIPLSNNSFSHVVQVKSFMHYVDQATSDGLLLQQYHMIEELDIKSHTVGLEPQSITKNRYKNIIAYDETRVKLLDCLYSNTSDYINANYINGFDKEKAFIATQAPTSSTVGDFWKMIWQENVQCVVMLSKLIECGKTKSEKYWPDENETSKHNEITITCINSETTDDITIRTFKTSSGSIERQLVQIHYEGWLDKDVPLSTEGIENVLQIMKNYENENPTVVHCSAGVGRTGTLILANNAVSMAKRTDTIDMLKIFYDLRQQRTKMVQTLDQYVFAHKVVANITAPIYANI